MGYGRERKDFFTEEQMSPDYFPIGHGMKFQKGDRVIVTKDEYKRYPRFVGRSGIIVGYKTGYAKFYLVDFEQYGKHYILSSELKKF